jgi:CheY-like chemotaxis protein
VVRFRAITARRNAVSETLNLVTLASAAPPAVVKNLLASLSAHVTASSSLAEAASQLAEEHADGLLLAGPEAAEHLTSLLRDHELLTQLPDGVALLDAENTIRWANPAMVAWCTCESVVGHNFYAVLGDPTILGPDYCPLHTAVATGSATSSTLRIGENRYLHVHATSLAGAPLTAATPPVAPLVLVSVRDVSRQILEQEKRAAIHQAGRQLADLTPDELADMTIEERIDLLKSNILHYSKDLLKFDVVEIRLLDPQTGRLEPLLAEGMEPVAQDRVLYARPEDNGVTGYVAATGKSYLCNDTLADPRYIEGCRDAKSSLTVALELHDRVIGTFNVESPKPGAFDTTDLQFLEIFSRDVAASLNTLELLVAEKASTAAESVEAIHGAVALPVDAILHEAVAVMEKYIGHDADVVARLQRILRNARDIKQVIQKVGETMTPTLAHAQLRQHDRRPGLANRRLLVVDADDQVRSAAHSLLERFGCTVEAARDGAEAISLVRASCGEPYDVIISDISLPDMSGYELLLKMRDLIDPVPLVLMTGFGYDPGHSIVKARQAGIELVLYKPFRIDQLLDTIDRAVAAFSAEKTAETTLPTPSGSPSEG